MYYGKFIKSIQGTDVVENVSSFGHTIRKFSDGSVFIDNIHTDYECVEEARSYLKNKAYSEKLERQIQDELYEELSYNKIATIIRENYNVKVTDTLIESYLELASSKLFTLDPVVYEIRKLNKLDVVVEGKIHYELSDGSVVAIDNDTQDILNNLLQQHNDVVEYMRECKENFLYVIGKIKE